MQTEVAKRAAELTRAGVPFVQVTVVRAQRPTSVVPGASALLHADGRIEGFVGGTCAEASVQVHGLSALRTGEPLLLRILPGADDTRIEDGAVTVSNPCLSGGALEIFLEPHRPPPRLVVVGDTPVGRMLAVLGEPLGFAVDPGGGLRPGDAALVVASFGRDEEPALTAALKAGVPYVGLVASHRRGRAVVAGLDVPPEARERVRTPAGLPLGSRTAAEVALSILAEIVQQRAAHAPHPPVADDRGAPDPAAAIDPVCGMTVAAVPATLQVERDGRTVYFCGAHCRDAFEGR